MANRTRNKCVSIRVSEQELAFIKRRIQKSNLSHREYILRCLIGKEIHVKEGGLEVVKELKMIGNNVNQIARKVNSGEISNCSPQLETVYLKLRELMNAWQ